MALPALTRTRIATNFKFVDFFISSSEISGSGCPYAEELPSHRTGEFLWKRRPNEAGRFAESGRDWRRVFQSSDDEERRLHRRRDDADGHRKGEEDGRRNRWRGRRILAIAGCEECSAAVVRHVGRMRMNASVQLRRNAQRNHPEKCGRDDPCDDGAKRIQPRMPGRSAYHGAELRVVAPVTQGKSNR